MDQSARSAAEDPSFGSRRVLAIASTQDADRPEKACLRPKARMPLEGILLPKPYPCKFISVAPGRARCRSSACRKAAASTM